MSKYRKQKTWSYSELVNDTPDANESDKSDTNHIESKNQNDNTISEHDSDDDMLSANDDPVM